MTATLTLLGTGTCQLDGRNASAALIELDGKRLVYDFGRGTAAALAARGLRQDDIGHVVLSHFHPDHLTDLLPYLQAASWSQIDPRSRDLHIWGPTGLDEQIMRLLGLFEVEWLVRRDQFRVQLHEIRHPVDTDAELDIGGQRYLWRELPPSGNHGLRWSCHGTTVALTGDGYEVEPLIDFLHGVDLAVIDAGHLDDNAIVEVAWRSAVDRLVCSHFYRELDVDALSAAARGAGWRGELILGTDGMSFSLD
ncbi:MAG: MBL fold metallo-hydrolase [Acidobacteriota bacterium]